MLKLLPNGIKMFKQYEIKNVFICSTHYQSTYCKKCSWAPVTHTCNPSYPGGRDQEDFSSKPAQANSS
jgi:hypothetical protein